ncbi:hypothetical protein HanOQP8_Chr15g0559411 [Helianthus annuus]|nr:hypothetical protein HanOQP8_Chr15g0559411 [Helianthus annuus]
MGDGTKRVEKERKKATPWTEEEHSYIRLCYGRKPLQDMGQMGSLTNGFLEKINLFRLLEVDINFA